METIILFGKEIEVISQEGLYSIRLNNDKPSVPIIPCDKDIMEFVLEQVPEYLEKIHVYVGNQKMITFDRDDFSNKQNLFPFSFPYSLVYSAYTDIKLEYNAKYVVSNSVVELVDEYTEEIEYSNNEVEIYDGCDYHIGYLVSRKMVPTGRQIGKVIKGATVTLPQIRFGVSKSDKAKNKMFELPVWETITLNPKYDEAYIQHLLNNRYLQMKDGSSIADAIQTGLPFEAKVQNIIRFTCGIAGKAFVF